jgi:hypothetical protein
MLRKILTIAIIAVAFLFFALPLYAATGCTVTSAIVDKYHDNVGEHTTIRVTVTQSGTTFSFTTGDFIAQVANEWKGYIYWIGIDPVGTHDAAPQLTITDKWSFTQFSDTTSFHVSNPIKVTGNSYDGQYIHVSDGMTFAFNDVGTTEVLYLFLDVVR